ncbi:hypothetical protein [Nannocystis radixulma]|uniref:Uncharacterized protein n=1 Tax=Nannocystis radixulma TaxID=2995305 RepID=A0ABT5BNN0_9BACT|nr:hypothetical protein [Nannocystis radixulma]MDC0675781.1 hypothetical protein [Nannocystis radixulma]
MNTATKATDLGIAFIANNSSNEILTCSSADAARWSSNVRANESSSETPAVCRFKGLFWTAFVSNDKADELLVCSSPDGKKWSANSKVGQRSEIAPSLCVFKDRMYIAFIADNDSRNILVCSTADGVNWSSNVKAGETSAFAPTLCAYKDRLWLAFVANNDSRELLVCNSSDGQHWSSNSKVNESTKQAPSLCVFKNRMWLAFVANDSSEGLLICSSDGNGWTKNAKMGQASNFAPSLAAVGDKLYVAFVSNNSKQDVLICSSREGSSGWSNNTKIGETSKCAPALFALELTKGTIRPKYQVLTVVYAPPGTNGGDSSSSVAYTNSSSAGTTSSISSSVQKSVEVTAKVGNDSVGAGASFGTSNTTSDTSTLNITKRESVTITVKGPDVDGIDHDHDAFHVCLNPLYTLTVDQLGDTTWEFGVDGSAMTIQYVYAGWLKDPSKMPVGTRKALDAAGLTTADYAAILAHNPFVGGATTIDPNRFMRTGQSFPYVPPYDEDSAPIIQTYQHENTIERSESRTSEVQYSVSASFTAGMPNIWSVETTASLTMTNSNTFGTSSSKTQSATLDVGGPSYGYAGPVDVQVYWDTVYNTFMFAFPSQGPDVSGQAAAGSAVNLKVGSTTLRTRADAKGEYRFYDVPAGAAKVSAGGATVSGKSLKKSVTLVS